jgi:phosphomannomutase
MKEEIIEHYSFHPSILREYDIRGIVDETLSEKDAFFIGKAFASFVLTHSKNKLICTGRDGRISSPALEQALIDGILSTGADVMRIGIGPTPMLYFASISQKAGGAIMVTGSHNPPSHNGFKFVFENKPFYGDQIRELGKLDNLLNGQGKKIPAPDLKCVYLSELLNAFKAPYTRLKVAWDSGNGATGQMVEKLCEELTGNHIAINTVIDGTFPAHHPDPTVPENLEQLIKVVQKENCDYGVAFDGDGDRVGVVDKRGRIIWGDQLLQLFAKDLLIENVGATIIADVKASQTLFDTIAQKGGIPCMWKTGHSHIKSKLFETRALLAGEMSGHIFFADEYYGYDDGLYAAVRLFDLLSRADTTLEEMIDELPETFNTPEIRIDCPDDIKFTVIDKIKEKLVAASISFNDIDGIRLNTDKGWWLLRASNTQASLVARCESKEEKDLDDLKADLSSYLNEFGLKL